MFSGKGTRRISVLTVIGTTLVGLLALLGLSAANAAPPYTTEATITSTFVPAAQAKTEATACGTSRRRRWAASRMESAGGAMGDICASPPRGRRGRFYPQIHPHMGMNHTGVIPFSASGSSSRSR